MAKLASAINALENGVSKVDLTNCIDMEGRVFTGEEVFAGVICFPTTLVIQLILLMAQAVTCTINKETGI
jgi:hypothetical protein